MIGRETTKQSGTDIEIDRQTVHDRWVCTERQYKTKSV